METAIEERILIYEDQKSIQKMHLEAQHRATELNKFCTIARVTTQKEYNVITMDVNAFVKREMLKDPEINKLSKLVGFETLTVPEVLRRVTTFLKANSDSSVLMKGLAFANGEWKVSEEYLEQLENEFKKYASTPTELCRYYAAEALCDFLNGENIGKINNRLFANEMIQFNLTDRLWHPSVQYILAPEDKYMA